MNADKFKLGFFVILAIVLIGMLFSLFGLNEFGSPKAKVVSYFTESVQGLEAGSLLKFRGVPIGKVEDIYILTESNVICVEMEVNLKKVRTERDDRFFRAMNQESFYNFLETELKKGLHAHLALNGISGYKYVELDYRPKDRTKPHQFFPCGLNKDGSFCIPSEPSMLAGLQYGITEIIAKIASIDFKKLADKIESVVSASDVLIRDPLVRATLKNIEKVSMESVKTIQTVNQTLSKERLISLSDNIEKTTESIRHLANRLDTIAEQTDFPETNKTFRNAANAVVDIKETVAESLRKLNESIDSLQELIHMLDENPSAILNGKRQRR